MRVHFKCKGIDWETIFVIDTDLVPEMCEFNPNEEGTGGKGAYLMQADFNVERKDFK